MRGQDQMEITLNEFVLHCRFMDQIKKLRCYNYYDFQ